MVQEHTVYQQAGKKVPSPDEPRLLLKNAAGRREIKLETGQCYLIGRAEEAFIRLDDQRLSRRHAEVRQENGAWVLVDLGSTNGTTVDGQRIDRLLLQDGIRFQVGATAFKFVAASAPQSVESRKSASVPTFASSNASSKQSAPRGRLLLIVSLLVVLLLGGLFWLKSAKKPAVTKPIAAGSKTDDVLVPVLPTPGSLSEVPPSAELAVPKTGSALDDVARSREHYRIGLLFYDSGHLKKAIEEWDLALAYDRNNNLVRRKLSRAVAALDEKIEEHYRQALVNLKYYRYHEARQELQIVIALVRNKQDERYQVAQKKLKELDNK